MWFQILPWEKMKMSDKNSWESFCDSVGGCFSLVCWVVFALIAIILAFVYLPGLTGGIGKAVGFCVAHPYVGIPVLFALFYFVDWVRGVWR